MSGYTNTSKALIRKAVKMFGTPFAVTLPSGSTCTTTAILQQNQLTTELSTPLCPGTLLDNRLLVVQSTRSAADIRHQVVSITHTATLQRLVDGPADTFGRRESTLQIIATGVLLHRVSATTDTLTLPSIHQGLTAPVYLLQDSVTVRPADRLIIGGQTYQVDTIDSPLQGLLQLSCSQQL